MLLMLRLLFAYTHRQEFFLIMPAIFHPEKMNLRFVFRKIYRSSTTKVRVLSPSRWSKIPLRESNQHNFSGHD
ncbi:MAG: hypothetical protein DMG94_08665 [Acidobacteria bacterium]|nr:MAG: hypothetical protein DMG94_08665 [Acidobacteriota bacterium]